MWVLHLLVCATIFLVGNVGVLGLTEETRRDEHKKRYGNNWPPPFIPKTEGWENLMGKRLAQVAAIEDRGQKYDGWKQTVSQAFLTANFTQYGFGLVRGPEELTETLRREVIGTYERGGAREEHAIQAIEGPERSLFVDRPDLTRRVKQELQAYTEAWAGIPLTPAIAYGFRIYMPGASLNMHIDKTQTHVISMIYHIGHDDEPDSEPWPIMIEDFEGNTHEVALEAGDILFYESSKCLHGRPKKFKGKYYTSVFVHYYPTDGWRTTNYDKESDYAIPLDWEAVVPLENGIPPLVIRGTSFKEPSCPNAWCNSEETIKWFGPGEDNYWIDAKGTKHPFEPRLIDRDEDEEL